MIWLFSIPLPLREVVPNGTTQECVHPMTQIDGEK
jgi:hypothetical protein